MHCKYQDEIDYINLFPASDAYIDTQTIFHINPLLARLSYLYFHPLEVVSRYRDTQLQVGENHMCV